MTFTTLQNVITKAVTEFDHWSATLGLVVKTAEFAGICWNTTGNPNAVADAHEVISDGSPGSFSKYVTELESETTYYVRAYIHFPDGNYEYGQEVTFTTTADNTDPKTYGVFIGNYRGWALALAGSAPNNAHEDAKGVRNALTPYVDFSPIPVDLDGDGKTENASLLLWDHYDSNNESQLNRVMSWLQTNMEPDDTLIFYFKGHGGRNEETDNASFVIHENKPAEDIFFKPQFFTKTGIQWDKPKLLDELEKLPQNSKKVIILCSCHGGAFWDGALEKLKDTSGKHTVTFLAAADADHFADSHWITKRCIYTNKLIDGLQKNTVGKAKADENEDGLTFFELAQWAHKKLIGETSIYEGRNLPIADWHIPRGYHLFEGFYDTYAGEDLFSGTPSTNNSPPTASSGGDQFVFLSEGASTETVTFDGSTSSDPDGDSLKYTWITNDSIFSNNETASLELSAGEYSICLFVNDGEYTSDQSCAKVVVSAESLPTIETETISSVTSSSAQLAGNVLDDGGASVTARGVCWSKWAGPTIFDDCTAASAAGTGEFTVDFTGLTAGATYYARAYATNSVGTDYGDDVSFTTEAAEGAPTVTTNSASSVTDSSATVGGNVTDQGSAEVTERGICLGTSENPTDCTAASTAGTGEFTVDFTGLTAGATYYARAYATNSAGTDYGDDVTFTTSHSPSKEGALKWAYITGGEVLSSSAIDDDGTIYFGCNDDYVYALNADGTLQWRYQTGGEVWSSPAIASDGTVYAGSKDAYVYALNTDGTLLWRYQTGDEITGSPAIGTDGTSHIPPAKPGA